MTDLPSRLLAVMERELQPVPEADRPAFVAVLQQKFRKLGYLEGLQAIKAWRAAKGLD